MFTDVADGPDQRGGVLLSRMEEGFWRGNLRIAVLMRLDGCIEAEPLARALERVQQRHPKLRASIAQGSDGRWRYHNDPAAPGIAFEITDWGEGESPWREETRRMVLLEPPPAGPVAAVAVLRNRALERSELIVSAHHGIADGRSGLVLVNDILTEYANAESPLPTLPRPALPLVSAVRLSQSGGWRDRLWLARRFVKQQRTDNQLRLTALPSGQDIQPLSQWVHWALSREDTLALVRRCRKEQVSPSGALVAAAYSSLVECLPVSEALFKWHCPFELRDSLHGPAGPVSGEDLGSFIGLMRGFDAVRQPLAFWDLARKVHRDLHGFVQHGGPGLSYKLSALALSAAARIQAALVPNAAKRPTLFFTNYGVLSVREAYGSLRPRECTLTFKDEEGAGPRLILEALVLNQRLNVGLTGDQLEPAFWERLHVAIRSHLIGAAVA